MIKIGYCIAYDWELIKDSITNVYPFADVICFSLDKFRRSWSGLQYEFNEQEFWSWINSIDILKKIKVYEDDFAIRSLSSMENENRQRSLMSKFLGWGGWHIQIDVDEFFIDFSEFKNYLEAINANPTGEEKPINICCNWISLFKKTSNGYLYVDNGRNNYESMVFATNSPEYLNGRRNSHFNHLSPFFVLHNTWARDDLELLQKISNWGHTNDNIKSSYFNFWKALDEHNFQYVKDFHPIEPATWKTLKLLPAKSIDDLIKWIRETKCFQIDKSCLLVTNSKTIQHIKHRFRKND